jgi:hypothetical protein
VTGPDEAPVPTPLEVAPDVVPLDLVEPAPEVVVIGDVAVDPLTPAEAVAAAVLAVPGVVRLHGGRFGELGTYLPGRRVTGVRIDDEGTEVHVVVSDLVPVPDTAARIRRAVSAIAPMPVRVHVEDIDTIV